MNSATFRDVTLLLGRIGIGVIFIAHGWQKFFDLGISGTQAMFTDMSVPLADIAAIIAATFELVGGVALLIGFAARIAGVLLFLVMLGAFWFVHVGNGIFVVDGGYELVLALGAGSLMIAGVGAGRFSVDAFAGKNSRILSPS
ncbi:DoxX family protein [Rhodococcus spongiicola]|uniref:DoxX family protein n=1 Tax=Rhodococcus spongiicola TaxID=2487352 RepID=A0A3S3BPR8_9NOCA|nr:DoxX family protein [Rhodococcus spongiicola]RVW06312.1 DoxX family protein [Rhodococcus spongiicola]